MPSATVRIGDAARKTLRSLARQEGASMQKVLDKAVEYYRRRRFLEEVNQAYAQLRQDETAWQSMKEEQEAWNATLMDGLPADEEWTDDGKARRPARRKERA